MKNTINCQFGLISTNKINASGLTLILVAVVHALLLTNQCQCHPVMLCHQAPSWFRSCIEITQYNKGLLILFNQIKKLLKIWQEFVKFNCCLTWRSRKNNQIIFLYLNYFLHNTQWERKETVIISQRYIIFIIQTNTTPFNIARMIWPNKVKTRLLCYLLFNENKKKILFPFC